MVWFRNWASDPGVDIGAPFVVKEDLHDFLRAGARTGQREKSAKRINLTLNGLARVLAVQQI